MKDDPAQALGRLLQEKRKELGYSTYDVASAAGVSESTVVRFEQGRFAAPRPDKLVRFAKLLDLSLADLYARVGYLLPDELPSFDAYLHAKYPSLPKRAATELGQRFRRLAQQHHLQLDHDPTDSQTGTR
jgi:transcriptional regulator with XRE-family HTH domain